MISIVINIVMGLVHGIYLGDKEYDHSIINTDINRLEDYEKEYVSEDKLQQGATVGTYTGETNLGDKLHWANLDWSLVLKNGINPLSFTPTDFDTAVEQVVAAMIILFRSLWMVLIALEAYLLLWGKKTT